jgi:argininosuccinate synthase
MEQAIESLAYLISGDDGDWFMDNTRNLLRTFAAAIASEVREAVTLELRAGLKNVVREKPKFANKSLESVYDV